MRFASKGTQVHQRGVIKQDQDKVWPYRSFGWNWLGRASTARRDGEQDQREQDSQEECH
jgi:hypothetical protein